MSVHATRDWITMSVLFCFQHLLANGKSRLGRPSVPRQPAAYERPGFRLDMRLLWTHLLCHQGPQFGSCPIWYNSGETHGAPCVHGLCLLGPYSFLWSHRCGRLPPDRCPTHKDPPGILLPSEFLCQSLPVCAANQTIQAWPLHLAE